MYSPSQAITAITFLFYKTICGGLTPAISQILTLPFPHSPLWGNGGGKNWRKARGLADQDNDSLKRKAKAVWASKEKIGINSLLPISSLMSSHFLRRASACIDSCLERQMPYHWNSCFLLLSLSFIAEYDAIWYGITVLSVWVSSPGYILSQPFAHPQPICMGEWGKREKSLTLCKNCSAIATSVLSTLF